MLTNAIRDVATVQQGFGTNQSYVSQGYDYAVIENARKLEEGVDYKVDTKLGFISLSTADAKAHADRDTHVLTDTAKIGRASCRERV